MRTITYGAGYCPKSMHKLAQVSWIRKSDLHVLTTGTHTFTGDRRFSALHQDMDQSWSLQIK